MAQIPGTVAGDVIVPSDTADVYPTHDADYGKGGRRTVDNVTARDAIPAQRRDVGMQVYVTNGETGMVYQLEDGVADENWHQIAEIKDLKPKQIPYGAGVTGMVTSDAYGEGLWFDKYGGYGDDWELNIKGGTNWCGINLTNWNGTTNSIMTNSSDHMYITAASSLRISISEDGPGVFEFLLGGGGHDATFMINADADSNAADGVIQMGHPGANSRWSYIKSDSGGAMWIDSYAGIYLAAGQRGDNSGDILAYTEEGDVKLEAGGAAYLQGTTSVALNVNDTGCQYAVISGAPIGSGNGAKLGFFNTSAVAIQTVTGAKGSNAALGSLLTALAAYGLIVDSTSA